MVLAMVLWGVSGFACFAQEPELFYFEKQQAFRVMGAKEGKITFEAVTDESEVSGYAGPRHDAWWVKGGLAVDPKVAYLGIGYRVKRVAETYANRHRPERYYVDPTLGAAPDHGIEAKEGLVYVMGWVVKGVVRSIAASTLYEMSPYRIEIGEADLDGYLMTWVFRDGSFLEKGNVKVWEEAFFSGDRTDLKTQLKTEDYLGRSVLHYACANGDLETVKAVLEANKHAVRSDDKNEDSPLSYAAEAGRDDIVSLLLEYKASLSDGWENLNSIPRKAARAGHLDVVKLLVPEKSRSREMAWHRSWAASDALNENYQDIALYLFEAGADITINKEVRGKFALAKARSGYPDMALALFDQFNIEPTYSEEGYNLMHAVSSYGDVDLLKKMETLGMSIRDKTEEGVEPLGFAVGNGNVDAICWLIDSGSSMDSDAVDLLKYAILNQQLSSVECLIGYGYDVNKEFAEGISPLMFAVFQRDREIAERIQEAGGAWLLSSPHLDFIAAGAVQMDSAKLIEALLDQGWTRDRKVFGSLSLEGIARFFDARSVLDLLDSRGWESGSREEISSVSDVEVKPRLLTPLKVDYPRDLQETYGSRTLKVELVLDKNGMPILVNVRSQKDEQELVPVVEKAVYQLKFEPAQIEENPVPVSLVVKIPLEAEYDPAHVLSLADVDVKPEAIRWVDPIYPQDLLFMGVRGETTVEFILLPNGEVVRARPVKATHEAFGKAAVLAVQLSTWKPAYKNGKPVACKVRAPVNFTR